MLAKMHSCLIILFRQKSWRCQKSLARNNEQVEEDQPLMEAGLDSLGAVELRNALNEQFGADLSATFMFDYPTMAAMAAHIHAAIVQRTAIELDQAQGIPHARDSRQTRAPVNHTDVYDAVNSVLKDLAVAVLPDQVNLLL